MRRKGPPAKRGNHGNAWRELILYSIDQAHILGAFRASGYMGRLVSEIKVAWLRANGTVY